WLVQAGREKRMNEQDENEFVSEGYTVVIEGEQPDRVYGPGDPLPAEAAAAADSDAAREEGSTTEMTSGPSALSARDEAIYTVRLLTAVAVGSVVEGADQLLIRLKQYQQDLQEAIEEPDEGAEAEVDEDELDRLRYATIGLLFETQNMIGRSLELAFKTMETSVDVADKVTKPFRNFFLFRPITKRVEKRFDGMAERGQGSLSHWVDLGRQIEPRSRLLATKTYEEIVDEFIQRLADNPEVKALVAQQSLSLAAGVRDEVRERTVTSDNVLEDIARRILRRQPRPELESPPPEVQRWAGISAEKLREYQSAKFDEQPDDSTE
ncbi:MAG: hypothetical protein ACK2U5_19990, partial [Candidatus Promineifilaceae bacterium]